GFGGVFEDETRRLVDGHGARPGGWIGRPSGVDGASSKAVLLLHGVETRGVKRVVVAVAALQVALFVTLGLPDAGLGVAWPSMRDAVDRPLGALGIVLAVGTIGYVAGSPSVSTVAGRFGTPRTMMVSSAVAAGALAVWSVTRSWPLLLVAALVLGVARGMID